TSSDLAECQDQNAEKRTRIPVATEAETATKAKTTMKTKKEKEIETSNHKGQDKGGKHHRRYHYDGGDRNGDQNGWHGLDHDCNQGQDQVRMRRRYRNDHGYGERDQ